MCPHRGFCAVSLCKDALVFIPAKPVYYGYSNQQNAPQKTAVLCDTGKGEFIMARVYNFSAGPSMLPEKVLKQAQAELLEYGDSGQSVIHICQNNTIFGTQFVEVPQVEGVPLVADMSSMILSKPVDVTKYGCIYFGVQKNVAPAGMAIAIVRDDLLGHAADNVPTMMNYTTLLGKDSMYNTPPCWCIYMTGLVLKYLENDIGGLANMQKINEAKAKVLYDYLDGQDFFTNPVEHRYRSTMNVTFTSPNADLDKKFCAEAAEAGFVNLKGHRLVGGMRASIYNAMPAEGVDKLVDFMEKFRKENA